MEVGQISCLHEDDQIFLELDNEVEKHGGTLVGKILTMKNLNVLVVISIIKKGWKLDEDVEVLEMDRTQLVFLFRFRKISDYARIIKGRPWSIMGFLLNLQVWNDLMVIKDVRFEEEPFWVQFHGLPLEAFSDVNAKKLGSVVGKVAMFERPKKEGRLERSYVRVRALVNLNNPLVQGFWIPRKKLSPAWISVKYERLQNLCFKYGRIGHDGRRCAKSIVDNQEERVEKKYGSWISVPYVRTIEEAVENCIPDWCENQFIRREPGARNHRRSWSSDSPEPAGGNLHPRNADCQIIRHWNKGTIDQKSANWREACSAVGGRDQESSGEGIQSEKLKTFNVVDVSTSHVLPVPSTSHPTGPNNEGVIREEAHENPMDHFETPSNLILGNSHGEGPSRLEEVSPQLIIDQLGYRVEFPCEEEPVQSCITPFKGLSPVSEVSLSFRNINLKRPYELEVGSENLKRQRKLVFEDTSPSQPVSPKRNLLDMISFDDALYRCHA